MASRIDGIVLFLSMPVYTMLFLSTYTEPVSDLISYFPGLLNGNSLRSFSAVIAVLAILTALTGFSYIHSRERLDFFHSLPVKRTTWFTTTYLSGLIIFLVPYMICCILTLIAGAVNKVMTAQLAQYSAVAALAVFWHFSSYTMPQFLLSC